MQKWARSMQEEAKEARWTWELQYSLLVHHEVVNGHWKGKTGRTFQESEQQRRQKCYVAHVLSILQNREIGWNSKPCASLSCHLGISDLVASHLLLLPSGLIIDGCCSQRANDHAADRPCHLHAVIELRRLPTMPAPVRVRARRKQHNPFTRGK